MPRPSFSASGERGVVIPLIVVVIIALLTVIGLAIDSGNQYRAQVALQNSADAAALSTVNYLTLKGRMNLERQWGITSANANAAAPNIQVREAALSARLLPMAQAIARANMYMAHLPHLNDGKHQVDMPAETNKLKLGATIGVNGPVYEYSTAVTRNVDYLLMNLIPIISGKANRLHASAKARRNSTNISLLLDVSDSMRCPKDATTPCTCLFPAANGTRPACPASGARRFDDLVEATAELLKLVDLDRDEVHFVPFNISAMARTVGGSGPLSLAAEFGVDLTNITSAQLDAFAGYLAGIYPPMSATNPSDALLQAWALMNSVNPGEPSTYILFTDGAPTAARFLFSSAAAATGKLQKSTSGYMTPTGTLTYDNSLGLYDYMHYTVEWVDEANVFRAGPSLLVESGKLLANARQTQLYNPPLTRPEKPTRTGGCQEGLSSAPPVSATATASSAAAKTFACVNSLELHLPSDPASLYGANYNQAADTLQYWREQYYNATIQLSDFIRSKKGVLNVVGLGARSNSTKLDPTKDAYELIDDNWGRKDNFNTRLAFDLKNRNSAWKEFSYNGYKSYDALIQGGVSERAGVYYPTHNSADIKLLFTKIARKLLLKLVE